ncbi:MAG: hypothetical protein NTZ48_03060, partial [Candidatus Omnitrophica bacterium]|nr:hypothetical protein [Candidatus Omnitrophota bacterium]
MRKITFILVFISAVICKSLASAYSDSPLTDLLLNTFCREFNLLLKEKGFLENEIITIEDAPLASPDVFSPLFIKKLREGGYPVGLYTLEKKEDVARVPLFMTEWDAKLAVVKKNGEGYLIFQDESSISLDNSDEFFKKWSTNYIIAPFSTGIWQAIKNDTDKNNLIFIIYAYHNMPVDILLKEVEKIISDSQG